MVMVSVSVMAQSTNDTGVKVLIWGDSLSAAYGMDVQDGWVALLRQRLDGQNITVINSSISGETTQGGLARLAPALTKHQPDVLVLELGANDGLRGLPVAEMRANLESMITQAKEIGAEVVLLGMYLPPNYGVRYTRSFSQTFEELAKAHETEWVPFFLDGVADDYGLLQADNLHPNAKAQPKILENVWPALEAVLAKSVKNEG